MKRKYSILILLLNIVCFQAISQSKKSISAIAGYSDNGFASTINFQFYPEHTFQNFYELSLYKGFLEETKTDYKVKLNIYSINAGYRLLNSCHIGMRRISQY